MLRAIVELTHETGYADLTDAQIASSAGVSTEAFHRHFADKEECLLAVLDELARETLDRARGALDDAGSWEQGVVRAIGAFVADLVAREALARVVFIDVFEAGPAAIGGFTRPVAALVAALDQRGPVPARGPRVAQEAVTGAVWGVISAFVAAGRLGRLPSLVEHLSYTVLAPYVGGRRAVQALGATRRRG
jgi:AcrR family transcriptional regulator